MTLKLEDNDQFGSEGPPEPPADEMDSALLLVINADIYRVLAHRGRYFYWTCTMNGEWDGEMVGCALPLDIDPGYYVFESGLVKVSTDHETGHTEWNGITGTTRKAGYADFADWGVEDPFALCPPRVPGDGWEVRGGTVEGKAVFVHMPEQPDMPIYIPGSLPEARRRAELIAASPEMRDALEEAMKVIRCYARGEEWDVEYGGVGLEAERCIDKADGRSSIFF